jgi:hypothetical protein
MLRGGYSRALCERGLLLRGRRLNANGEERKIAAQGGYRSRNKRRYIQESGCYMMLQQLSEALVPSDCQTASWSKYSRKGEGFSRVIYNIGIRPLGWMINCFCETTCGDYCHFKTRKKVLYFPLAAVLSLDAGVSSGKVCRSVNWVMGLSSDASRSSTVPLPAAVDLVRTADPTDYPARTSSQSSSSRVSLVGLYSDRWQPMIA